MTQQQIILIESISPGGSLLAEMCALLLREEDIMVRLMSSRSEYESVCVNEAREVDEDAWNRLYTRMPMRVDYKPPKGDSPRYMHAPHPRKRWGAP